MSDVPVPGLQYIDDSQLSWTGIAGLPHLAPPLLPDVSDELNALPVYGEDYTPVTAPYWQLEYAFTGNYVSVVGVTFPWVEGVPASAVCSVDNQFQQTYMAPQATQASVNVSYYTLTAHQLTDGQHTLHINVTLASSLNPFVLDYLVVGTDPDSTVPTSSSTSSGTGTTALQSSTASTNNTSSTSAQPTSTTSKLNPTASDKPASSSASSSSFPLAPVVGAVAGGIVAIAAFLALLFYLRRRSHYDQREASEGAAAAPKVPPPDTPKERAVVSPPPDSHGGLDDLVPTLPPGKGSMYSAGRASPQPTLQPATVGMHPSSMPYFGGQGQGWTQPAPAPMEWPQQYPSFSPSESRTQTMYSSNPPWEHWSNHPQATWSQSQPGYTTPPPAPYADLPYHGGYAMSAHMPVPPHGGMPAQMPSPAVAPSPAPTASINPGEFVPQAHSEPFTSVARAAAAAALSPGTVINPAQAQAAPITAAFMIPPSPSPPPTGTYAAARANAEHLGVERSTASADAQTRVDPPKGRSAHALGPVPSDISSGIHAAQDRAGTFSDATVPGAIDREAPAHLSPAPASEAASLHARATPYIAPSADSPGDSPALTRRMHGGMMEYDGKESRLTSGRGDGAMNALNAVNELDAVSVSGGKAEAEGASAGAAVARTGSDSEDGQRSNASSASPPAYVP